MENSWNNSYPL